MKKQKVIIFSAPSAAGKTTIVRHLLEKFSFLAFSISATTRPRRPNEIAGRDYHYLTLAEFKEKIAQKAFVEYEEVYQGLFYGTLQSEIERIWQEGKIALFDIDVKGGINLKKYFGSQALSIFVKPPSLTALAERLEKRQTESEERKAERLKKAQEEMQFEADFDCVLLNDDLDTALKEAEKLLLQFLEVETA
ncbi:guanylate kinase [Hugenholtzia roseola]|uniref:guanylate kinase n=1 Tax=Hugenholtzia roseola TaxID=1002 RepID=UPI00047969CC|nr:guanylate kinase [Hugenholtzia roseola]